MNDKSIDFKTLFLGTKGENKDLYSQMLVDTIDDVADWRKNFHPEDGDIITNQDKNSGSYIYTTDQMKDVLSQLSTKLRTGLTPWHSPRYLGHMNSDVLVPGMVAYFQTMFFNPNNCAYEGGPATGVLESEVGMDFVKLLGYDHDKGWGHICTDGSVANYEALWYARNMKSIGYSLKYVIPDAVKGLSDWELLTLSSEKILDILDKNLDKIDLVKSKSVRNNPSSLPLLGKLFVPSTKHYSWLKAMDILGVGMDNIVEIDVDENYRMNVADLEKALLDCISKKIPILGVVSVVATTEEGGVDHVDKVAALRDKIQKEHNVWFYYHVDAAFGGYGRSIFLDENSNFIPFEDLQKVYKEKHVFSKDIGYPSRDVYEAFKAIPHADSVTIDPHKMGYVPYSAGGIAIKDQRMTKAISYFAAYAIDTRITVPVLLGAYILEGSKPGAAAAAVWTNHRLIPLNVNGYGRLVGNSIEGAYNFREHLLTKKQYVVNNKKVNVHILTKLDFNVVDFIFNYEGNTDLDVTNDLNMKIYEESCFVEGEMYDIDVLFSHSSFAYSDYKDAPVENLKSFGIDPSKYQNNGNLNILRSCVLSPWLHDKKVADYYFDIFDKAIEAKLKKIIK